MSAEYKRQWYLANRERISAKNKERREHRKEIHDSWRSKNMDRIRTRNRLWRKKNVEHVLAYSRKWGKANRSKFRHKKALYTRLRRATNIEFKIKDTLRSSLSKTLRKNTASKHSSVMKLLGCSIKDFRIYIESKFEVGMSWKNYGRIGWHLDHIMPCAIFDLSKPEHQKRCFHFSNMQPMWAHENHSKSAKVLSDQFRLL